MKPLGNQIGRSLSNRRRNDMRWVLYLGLVVFLVPSVNEAAKAKANSLSKKEIADGWILLFDGETEFGWKTSPKATVKNGVLRISDQKVSWAATTNAFQYFELRFDFRGNRNGRKEP